MVKIIDSSKLITESDIAALPAHHKEWVYNGLDCCLTLEILNKLLPQLDETSKKVYEFSKALQAPILEMQLRGVKIDRKEKAMFIKKLEADQAHVEKNFKRLVAEAYEFPECKWSSNKDLIELFYTRLGFKEIKKRQPTGKYTPTVDVSALAELRLYKYAQPLCDHISVLRDTQKKLSFLRTSVDSDGFMRSTFNIAGTVTGRFASSESEYGTGTNLQNVGRSLRSVMSAREGMKFGNIDLEQADARNLGALCYNIFYESHGPEIAGAFLDAAESGDLHTAVAIGAYPHLPWTDDKLENRAIADDKNNYAYRDFTYRDQAKRLGHGTNFYGKPANMSKQTKIPKADVEAFQKNYFAKFPCITDYHKWVQKQLLEERSLTTLFGRRRYFWDRPNDDKTLRDAIAYSPQSMTADEINNGILNLFRARKVFPLIQVHDSILFEYPEDADEVEIITEAMQCMTIPIKLKGGRTFEVPTDAEIGWNWGKYDKRTGENPLGLIGWSGTKDKRVRVNGECKWVD